VCHAYFRINCDKHCYRNAETRETCPDTLPELTVAQAEAILASRRGPQRQRRRVVPLTGASVEASTRIEPLTTTESISEPAVFIDSETVVRTPAPPLDTTAPGPERRLRVVPVGQAVTAPSRPLTTAPPVISHHAAPSSVYATQAIPSMSTPAEAADYIGAAFERRVDLREVTLAIASVFSSLDASRWPATVSDDDTMDFWTRARGDDLLALALSQPNCGEVVDTECFALMLLVSHMPLANTHESSGLLFLERIGVMGFVDQNIDQLRHRLSLSGRNLYYSNGYELDARANAIYCGFARNWPIRFPQIVGDSIRARSMVLRHRIFGYQYLSSATFSHEPQLDLHIDRTNAFDSLGMQLSGFNAASLRLGVGSVRYTGESAGGRGLFNQFFSLVSASVVGESPTALFATHPGLGFERISAGADEANLARYRTLGHFFALCVVSGNPTGIPLPAMFFRRLLGQSVSLDDVHIFDEDWVRGARFFTEATNQEDLDSFVFGGPLPGSGSEEPLTIENRDEMMQRAIENLITNNSPAQFNAIAEGFFYVLPRELLDGITGEDLEDIIVGALDVSAADLIANIRFHDVSPNRQEWLINTINGFTPTQRRLFLRFVTG
jgi:hypothetical protein